MAHFGCCKESEIGRVSGPAAIDESLRTRSIWINRAEGVPSLFVLH
jgi:acyl-CoA reductase-like NAD-dependent aldehyde dehydrogenase